MPSPPSGSSKIAPPSQSAPLTPGVLASASRIRQLAGCLIAPRTLTHEEWQRIVASERPAKAFSSGRPDSPYSAEEEVEEVQMDELAGAAQAAAAEEEPEPQTVYNLLKDRTTGSTELLVPPGNALHTALAILGERIQQAVTEVLAEIEQQMLLVFGQHDDLRKEYEAEGELLRKHRWEAGTPPRGGSPTRCDASARGSPSPRAGVMSAVDTNPGAGRVGRYGGGAGQGLSGHQALLAHLHLSLATVRSSCGAARAYLYLFEDDGAGCLRCVATAGEADAADLTLAAGGVVATVFQTGVALAVVNAPGCEPGEVLAVPVPGSPAEAPRIPVRRGGTAPAQGVLVLQTKIRSQGSGQGFTQEDETELASLARQLRALLKLYPASEMFRRRFDTSGLRRLALPCPGPASVPPPADDQAVVFDDAAADSARHGEQLVLRLRSAQPLSIVQADDIAAPQAAVKDPQAVAHNTISLCARLKETAAYVANLEQMWRNCIDEKAGMQQEVVAWQRRVRDKDAELTNIHTAFKELTAKHQQVKADLQRLRKAAAAAAHDHQHQLGGRRPSRERRTTLGEGRHRRPSANEAPSLPAVGADLAAMRRGRGNSPAKPQSMRIPPRPPGVAGSPAVLALDGGPQQLPALVSRTNSAAFTPAPPARYASMAAKPRPA